MTARGDAPSNGQDTAQDLTPKGFDDYELALGDILRGERATLGKSLLEVQRDIKIKASYIAAIEDADLSAFETPGFIAGYVRSYARYLGLDPDLVYSAFCEQSGFSHVEGLEARVYARPRAEPRKRTILRPRRAAATDPVLARNPLIRAPKTGPFHDIRPGAVLSVAALLFLLGGLGYGANAVLQSIQRVTLAPADAPVVTLDVGPDLNAAGGSAAGGAGDGQTAGIVRPSGDALLSLYRPQVLDAPVLVARDGPISTLDPDAQGAFAGVGRPQGVAEPAPTRLAALAPAQPGLLESYLPEPQGPPAPVDLAAREDDVEVVAPPPGDVVLFTTEPVWLRIRATDGTVLLEKTMAAGERFVLPPSETPPDLRAGNSGALFFMVNGQTRGPAGPPGSVTSGVDLSVDALSARYAQVDLNTRPEVKRVAALVLAPEDADPDAPEPATP